LEANRPGVERLAEGLRCASSVVLIVHGVVVSTTCLHVSINETRQKAISRPMRYMTLYRTRRESLFHGGFGGNPWDFETIKALDPGRTKAGG
jgi:hypothetical protein